MEMDKFQHQMSAKYRHRTGMESSGVSADGQKARDEDNSAG
jgi:hypothetical protein